MMEERGGGGGKMKRRKERCKERLRGERERKKNRPSPGLNY